MAKQKREELGVKQGDSIIIKGNVVFARIDKLIEGEDLQKENERRSKLGMISATSPFRSIAIENPEIVKGQDTPLAKYYAQTVYTGKKSNKKTMSLESKSKYPPAFAHIEEGKIVPIKDPKKNPATGQVVYLYIEAYKPKGYNNLGSSFNSILYGEGPIKFYQNSNLEGFGEALNMEVAEDANEDVETQAVDTEPENTDVFGITDDDLNESSDGAVENPFNIG